MAKSSRSKKPSESSQASSEASPKASKRTLGAIFLVVVIDLMGFGIVLPLLPFFAQEFAASPWVTGALFSVFSFMQLIFSPLWGRLSDRVGRRPIMMMSTFGAVLAYLLFAFSTSLAMLFASRILAGMMGGNISTAQAAISDSTPADQRAAGMGLIGAAFGIGFVLGPAMASGLASPGVLEWASQLATQWAPDSFLPALVSTPFGLPGIVAALMSAISFVWVVWALPETAPSKVAAMEVAAHDVATEGVATEDSSKTHSPENDSPMRARPSVFSPRFWRQLVDQQRQTGGFLIPLLITYLLLSFGEASLYAAFPLLAEAKLGLAPQDVGIQFFYIGMIAVIVQGGLIRPLTKRFREESLFLVGNILMVIGLAAIAWSATILHLTLALGLLALGKSLNTPMITSLISKQARADQVGEIMGTAQGFSGLGRMLGPTWGGLFYGWIP
ncbi:MAG: MFS transporter, partial [Bacteroidetes bacterium]|nr:MFS transporter [Bacteroidota bacterium]